MICRAVCLAGRSVRFPVGLVAGLFGRRFSAAGFWWPVRTVADSFGEYFLSGRLAGFWVGWFSGAIFPSAVAEMSVMREAVPVEGAERSVFEPLQLSAVRDPADGVERGAEPGEEVGGETFRVCALGRKQKDVVLAGAGGGPDVRICGGRNPLGVDGGADA